MTLFRADAGHPLAFPLLAPREAVSRHIPPVNGQMPAARRVAGTGDFSLVSSAAEYRSAKVALQGHCYFAHQPRQHIPDAATFHGVEKGSNELEVVGHSKFKKAIASGFIVEAGFINSKECNCLQMKRPLVPNAPIEFDRKSARGGLYIRHQACNNLGVLNIVQSKPHAKEQIILQYTGRVPASPVVTPFSEKAEVGGRGKYRIKRIFCAENERSVILFPARAVQGAGPLQRFNLEQPVLQRQLGIQPKLANFFVVRNQRQPAAAIYARQEEGVPTVSVERAEADIERSKTLAVAGGKIEVPLAGLTLVSDLLIVYDQ